MDNLIKNQYDIKMSLLSAVMRWFNHNLIKNPETTALYKQSSDETTTSWHSRRRQRYVKWYSAFTEVIIMSS